MPMFWAVWLSEYADWLFFCLLSFYLGCRWLLYWIDGYFNDFSQFRENSIFFSHNGVPSVFKNSLLPPVWLYPFYLYRVLYLTMLHPVWSSNWCICCLWLVIKLVYVEILRVLVLMCCVFGWWLCFCFSSKSEQSLIELVVLFKAINIQNGNEETCLVFLWLSE